FGMWDLGFLSGALPVHNHGIERLALAEIDEVIWRRLRRVELDQILQPVSGNGGRDTAVERAEVFRFALPLLAIEVYQPACRFGDAPRRNLRDHLAEVRAF